MTIGENIKNLRIQRGLTQKELATRAGIPVVTLQQYERGVRKQPKLELLTKIAQALGTTVVFLQGYIDDPQINLDHLVFPLNVEETVRKRAIAEIKATDLTDIYAVFGTFDPYPQELNGEKKLTYSFIKKLADELGVTPEYLIGLENEKKSINLISIEERASELRGQSKTQIDNQSDENLSSDIELALEQHIELVKTICIKADVNPKSIPDRIKVATEIIKQNEWLIDGMGGGKIN